MDRTLNRWKLSWYKTDDNDFHLMTIDRLILPRFIASHILIDDECINILNVFKNLFSTRVENN